MMKIIILICLVASTLAEIDQENNKYEQDLYPNFNFLESHYLQHQQSINAAKASTAQRIAKLEQNLGTTGLNQVHYSSGHASGGTQRFVAGCTYCVDSSAGRAGGSYDSRSSSRNSGSEITDDYHGVGVVGHSSDMRNSRLSSSRSDDVQTFVAPTYSSSASSKYSEADDLQQRQVPVYYPGAEKASRYSASSSNQESHTRAEAVPIYRPSSSTRYSSSSANRESLRSETVPYVPTSSRSHSHQQHEENEESRTSEHGQGTNTYYIPSAGRYAVHARPGSTTYIRVPVRVSSTGEKIGSTEHSESASNTRTQAGGVNSIYYRPTVYNETSSSYRAENRAERVLPGSQQVVYYPVVHSTGSVDRNADESRSEFRNYDSYRVPAVTERSQSRHQSETTHTQTQYVAPTSVPRHGGSRYYPDRTYNTYQPAYRSQTRTSESAEDESDLTQTRIPAGQSTSYLSSSRQHESRGQTGGTYHVPVPVRTSQNSAHRSESVSGSSSSRVAPVYVEPVYVEPVDYESRSRSSSRQEGHTQHGVAYSPTYSHSQRVSGSEHDSRSSSGYGQREYVVPSSRLGTSVLDTNTDLNSYMSESERLARLQSKSISSGSSTSSNYGSITNVDEVNRRTLQQAENLDAATADFVNAQDSSNRLSLDGLDASNLGATGGYKRIKSWQKQSKWASGSQYGPDGKLKSHSMLSTAESEKHNINGAETGYKAATTTLEDDGKVSTYSIHTP